MHCGRQWILSTLAIITQILNHMGTELHLWFINDVSTWYWSILAAPWTGWNYYAQCQGYVLHHIFWPIWADALKINILKAVSCMSETKTKKRAFLFEQHLQRKQCNVSFQQLIICPASLKIIILKIGFCLIERTKNIL